jgi:hypothetical protein
MVLRLLIEKWLVAGGQWPVKPVPWPADAEKAGHGFPQIFTDNALKIKTKDKKVYPG